MSYHLHEYEPGGPEDGGQDSGRCRHCGEDEAHWHHHDDSGFPWQDMNSVFNRMRADGSLSPYMDGLTHDEKVREERVERERAGGAT